MAGGFKLLGILFSVLLFPYGSFGQESGDVVVLVYNSKSLASKAIADHYAARRRVPASQIIGLPLPETESISREEFEKALQQPLWAEMRARKLLVYRSPEIALAPGSTQQCNVVEAKVRYAVLCYGVPVKISPDPTRKEEITETLRAELRRNEASVDSELALLPLLDRKLPITGFVANPLYAATNALSLNPINGILMVARLDGPSPQLAMALVDKAMQAEEEGLWGRAYFDLRGITEGPYRDGDEWIRSAGEAARKYGFETITDKGSDTFPAKTPMSDIALYFGWYDQSVSGPFTNGMAQFRPGAVAYHLHSFSARSVRVTDLWWAGPLIAAGATATMGCTEEPYLQTTPHPNVFLTRFLFLGFSFGEAAYASQVALSWQNTIIGDPLYRPCAKTQQQRYEQLEKSRDRNLEWSMLMWINFRLAQGASLDEIEKFYITNPLTIRSAVLQEKLADLYCSRGKFFDAVEPYETALTLPMGPVQKLRVCLSAANLFSVVGKNDEGYAALKTVLHDYPAYPDKRDLYERLQKLASALHHQEEAAEYERLAKQS